ncbi:4-hydroxy-3-methylbut-2-enyl diphosphate reductase [uncultured Porphyromonas sp.]|uniref:4-hydroxy-3-methylbut-2-enyl diphosphate reductase n=1 Tax=uncultured Porphyromonas sp. TaxID=159274 RepID=UPI0025F5AA24|nr:4-hydroxy-3-methylbut-2-enyl diphosphate reductase [uncultured Porphyromonas sp.]
MIDIEINSKSGFCFGVVTAIEKAETELEGGHSLYSLGDIVHNSQEVSRLSEKGLRPIRYEDLSHLRDKRVLFRAHGEPPEVYAEARTRGLEIIDATCPVVLSLQRKIRKTYEKTSREGGQIVIFGKLGHAEVNGLVGQTEGHAIVVQSVSDVEEKVDLSRPVYLFSQTTMDGMAYRELIGYVSDHLRPGVYFESHDTICRQVANRMKDLIDFAKSKDVIYFIAGQNSSNGKVLYHAALQANPHTYFISDPSEITVPLPPEVRTVGVTGATSTPMWQMEQVRDRLRELNP